MTPLRYDSIPRGEPRLLQGARRFNRGHYFEAHEAWESLWHDVEGRELPLLQGLIQLAAAYHHLTQKNLPGATYLYARGRARLIPWLPMHAGMRLAEWLARVDEDFTRLTEGRARQRSRPTLKIVLAR